MRTIALVTTIAVGVAAPALGGLARAAHVWKPGDAVPSLRQAFQGEFHVGAAINVGMLRDGDTRRFLERQFDVVVPETEMKPLTLNPREGQYDFADADAIVAWASQHGIKVRGHCLIWRLQEPAWMFTRDGQPLSRDEVVQRMRDYIHTVVAHFKGRVWAWDVVNEAIVAGEPGSEVTHGWRRSRWYDALGPDYVALAFQFAHEADPGALLFYNDYETQNPVRREMIVRLVQSLRARGIAIDGIGHQAHYTLSHPDLVELEATVRAVAALGLRNHVTEMDLTLRPDLGLPVPPVTPDLEARQARRWGEIFRILGRNATDLDAVVLWGVNDEASWLGAPDQPLLFEHFRPTLPFWTVLGEARGP
jgi:endo-1,4-beta-xylanase